MCSSLMFEHVTLGHTTPFLLFLLESLIHWHLTMLTSWTHHCMWCLLSTPTSWACQPLEFIIWHMNMHLSYAHACTSINLPLMSIPFFKPFNTLIWYFSHSTTSEAQETAKKTPEAWNVEIHCQLKSYLASYHFFPFSLIINHNYI